METGIKRLLLALTLVLFATSAYGTVRVGLLPIEIDSSLQRDARTALLERTLTEGLYTMLEETLQNRQFSLLFDKSHPAYQFEPLYGLPTLKEGSKLFDLDSPILQTYLMNRYVLDVLIGCRLSSLDSFTILDLYLYDQNQRKTAVHTQMIESHTLSFDQIEAFRASVEALERRELLAVSVADEDEGIWLSIGAMDSPLSSQDPLFLIVPREKTEIRILHSGALVDTLTYDLEEGAQQLVLPPIAYSPERLEETIITDPGNRIIHEDSVTSLPYISIGFTRGERIALQLSSERDRRTFLIEPEGGGVHYLSLSPFEASENWSQKSSEEFYRSLSLTILSLPLTILSRFMYDQTGAQWLQAVTMTSNGVTAVLALSTVSQVLRYYDSVN